MSKSAEIESLKETVDFWRDLAESRLTQIQNLDARIAETVKWLRLYVPQLEQLKLLIEGDINELTEDWYAG